MATDYSNNKTPVEIRKHNIELLWFISEKWFRILEFSLILATLYYFIDKTHNIFIVAIYWFSWMIFWSWFTEIGEFLTEKITEGKKLSKNKKLLVWILSMIPVIAIYTVITMAANSIMSAK